MLPPTVSKSKVPRGWCYPIGAEVVSEAMLGTPQHEVLCLRLLWVHPSSRWSSRDGSRAHLASLHYTPLERTAMERFWMLDISAVLSEEKPLLKPLLHDEVLPRFRRWMTTPRPPIWFEALQSVSATYNWDGGAVEYQESG